MLSVNCNESQPASNLLPPTDPVLLPLITTRFYSALPVAVDNSRKRLEGHSSLLVCYVTSLFFGSGVIWHPPSVFQFARINLSVLGEADTAGCKRQSEISLLLGTNCELSLHCSVLTYGSGGYLHQSTRTIFGDMHKRCPKSCLPRRERREALRLKKVSHERYNVTVRRVSYDNIDSAPPRAIMGPINHLIKEHSMTLEVIGGSYALMSLSGSL